MTPESSISVRKMLLFLVESVIKVKKRAMIVIRLKVVGNVTFSLLFNEITVTFSDWFFIEFKSLISFVFAKVYVIFHMFLFIFIIFYINKNYVKCISLITFFL